MPPWQIEEQAPDIWMERALAWQKAKNEHRASSQKPPAGEWRQVGTKRKKRLI